MNEPNGVYILDGVRHTRSTDELAPSSIVPPNTPFIVYNDSGYLLQKSKAPSFVGARTYLLIPERAIDIQDGACEPKQRLTWEGLQGSPILCDAATRIMASLCTDTADSNNPDKWDFDSLANAACNAATALVKEMCKRGWIK